MRNHSPASAHRNEPLRDPVFGLPVMTWDEIAAELGISKQAAERTCDRALKKIRRRLGLMQRPMA